MTKLEQLEQRLEKLEKAYAALVGNPWDNGKISMEEARLACERGDKLTVKKYNEQFRPGSAGASVGGKVQ